MDHLVLWWQWMLSVFCLSIFSMRKYTSAFLSGIIITFPFFLLLKAKFRFLFIFLGTFLAFFYWGLHWSSAALRIKHLKSHVRVRSKWIASEEKYTGFMITGGISTKRKSTDMFEQTFWGLASPSLTSQKYRQTNFPRNCEHACQMLFGEVKRKSSENKSVQYSWILQRWYGKTWEWRRRQHWCEWQVLSAWWWKAEKGYISRLDWWRP